nr:sensor histidine kinase [uncultured Blautia sp.]
MYKPIIIIFLGIISLLIIKDFIEIFLSKKIFKLGKLFWMFTILIASMLEQSSGNPWLNLFFNFFFILGICICRYKGELKKKVLVSLSVIIMWVLMELFSGYIFMIVGCDFIEPKLEGSIISKLFAFIVVKIVKIIHPSSVLNKVFKLWITLILLPILSLFIVVYIFYMTAICGNHNLIIGGVIVSALFLPLNLCVFKVYEVFLKEHEIERRNLVFEQQLNLYGSQIQEKENMLLKSRCIAHDYKKHLLVIQNFALNNKCDDINSYISELTLSGINANDTIVDSGNLVIDTLINSKYSIALKENIQYTAEVLVPTSMNFSDADLCIILGNALENALEAAKKVENQERYIQSSIVYSGGKLKIGIRNSFDGFINSDKFGNLISSKRNNQNHGMGINSINMAAEKYNGFVNTDYNEKEFLIIIVIKEPQAEIIT